MSYSATASSWHDFYVIAGTASATLVGLLFVGLSLHLRVVVARADVRSLARVTLANFGLVLFVSLFIVIPNNQSATALQVIGSGLVTLLIAAPSIVSAARSRGRMLRLPQLILRFGLSGISYVMVIVAGVLLQSSFPAGFGFLVAPTVLLLFVSLRNTWDLLVTVADVTAGDTGKAG